MGWLEIAAAPNASVGDGWPLGRSFPMFCFDRFPIALTRAIILGDPDGNEIATASNAFAVDHVPAPAPVLTIARLSCIIDRLMNDIWRLSI
ncbi:MAG: hypothetical protein ISN29_01975 [Gammaproteobacteria bacterium AqS3]|nr:hypothetical protein [Gammaproteobacteria bacterium AqS3]